MKLPRDISGRDLTKQLERQYGYRVTRTKGSHMTVTRTTDTDRHSLTVPVHRELRLETLDAIMTEMVGHPGVPKSTVR